MQLEVLRELSFHRQFRLLTQNISITTPQKKYMPKKLHCISSARETLNNFIVCASFIAFEFSKQAENKLTTSPQPYAIVACNHILRVGTYTKFNKARFRSECLNDGTEIGELSVSSSFGKEPAM